MPTTNTDPRNAVSIRLHKNIPELKRLRKSADRLEATIFADTYDWVEKTMKQRGTFQHLTEAFQAFSDTFKVTPSQGRSWYESGRYMANNNLKPSRVQAAAVRSVQTSESKMDRRGQLEALQAVKDGVKPADLTKIISASVLRKMAKSDQDDSKKKPSLRTLKAKMRALQMFAFELYESDVTVVVEVNGKREVEL